MSDTLYSVQERPSIKMLKGDCCSESKYQYTLEFLLILPVLRPTHGSLPIGPLIDIPKGFSPKMTLEVAPGALEFRISDMAIFVFFPLFCGMPFR